MNNGRYARRWVALLLFVGVTCLYVAISRGVFVYGDDVLMYQVTEGLVEEHSFAVQSPSDQGVVTRSIPGRDGRNYAKYGIGQSLLGVPFYLLSKWVLEPVVPLPELHDDVGNLRMGVRIWGTSLASAVAGGAAVAVFFLTAIDLGYSLRTSYALTLLLATGTLLAHYAATFMSEALTACCLLVAFYGLLKAWHEEPSVRWLMLSGTAAGLAVATKPATVLALAPMGFWFLWMLRDRWSATAKSTMIALLSWSIPTVAWLSAIAFYNWSRFGSVTETGYGHEADNFKTSLWEGLAGLLLSPGRGLFWYSPPLMLAVAGAYLLIRRQPRPGLVIVVSSGAFLLLCSAYYQWHGGGVWGPRFLVPIIPLLLLPAGEIVERAWRNWRLAVTVGVIAIAGLVVTALGSFYRFDAYIAEIGGSVDAIDATLWSFSDSQLVVHLSRINLFDLEADWAAHRYKSPHLTYLCGMLALLGVLTLGAAGYVVARAMLRNRLVDQDLPGVRIRHV